MKYLLAMEYPRFNQLKRGEAGLEELKGATKWKVNCQTGLGSVFTLVSQAPCHYSIQYYSLYD